MIRLFRLLLDPRRPLGEPSEADKAEHLAKYSPFIPVIHKTTLSYNHTIARVAALQATQTHLESTSLVVAVGAYGWDCLRDPEFDDKRCLSGVLTPCLSCLTHYPPPLLLLID